MDIKEIERLCAAGTEAHGDEFYGPILAALSHPPVDAGEDGWIEWGGDICPVHVETPIIVRLRNGWVSSGTAVAGYHRWDHGRTPESAADASLRNNDIVAYRIVATPTAATRTDVCDCRRQSDPDQFDHEDGCAAVRTPVADGVDRRMRAALQDIAEAEAIPNDAAAFVWCRDVARAALLPRQPDQGEG